MVKGKLVCNRIKKNSANFVELSLGAFFAIFFPDFFDQDYYGVYFGGCGTFPFSNKYDHHWKSEKLGAD